MGLLSFEHTLDISGQFVLCSLVDQIFATFPNANMFQNWPYKINPDENHLRAIAGYTSHIKCL